MVEAARALGCLEVLSEDLQNGMDFGGVKVTNPFLREVITVTKRGRPVARLVPVEPAPAKSVFGYLKGTGSVTGDIVAATVSPNAILFVDG